MPVSLNLWWELSFLRIIWGDWAYHSLAPCWAAMLTVLLKEWTQPWLQASWALIWMLSWIKGIFYTAGCRNMFPSLFKIRLLSPSLLLSRVDSLRRLLSHCSAAVVLKTEGPLKRWHAHIWVAFSYYFVLQELWRWVLLQRVFFLPNTSQSMYRLHYLTDKGCWACPQHETNNCRQYSKHKNCN